MRRIDIPEPIHTALNDGAALAVSISGGKDSQGMLEAIAEERERAGWPGEVFAIHAHLGRMEWPQTLAHCEKMAAAVGMPLVVVSRPQGDLLQEMWDRFEKLRGENKPHWPSAQNRYCTSDQKRNQIDKVLRAAPFPDSKNRYCTSHHKTNQIDKALRKHQVIISAEGIRADESPARAKRLAWEHRIQICTRERTAYTWRPLLHWTEADVWERIGHSLTDVQHRRELYRQGEQEEAFAGWRAHPAYVMGNQRLSCAMCVLASRADITNGARHNPELLAELVRMEDESGFSFRQDLRLGTLCITSVAEEDGAEKSGQMCLW